MLQLHIKNITISQFDCVVGEIIPYETDINIKINKIQYGTVNTHFRTMVLKYYERH